VADVRLYGLLRKEELNADFPVGETVADEPENLELTRRRCLTDLAERREWDDFTVAVRPAPSSDLLEATRVVLVAAQNLLALCGVHGSRIGVWDTTL
jgi:hypothetical protein